jgi:hypothetical protein
VKDGKVKPLSEEDRLTLVRWIDLGCPIDLDYDSAKPDARGYGWMLDDQRPTLTLTSPRAGVNPPLTRLLIGMHDTAGLVPESLQVKASFAIDGVAVGENLAGKFRSVSPGVWEWKLASPLDVKDGKLTVTVKDRQGNETRIDRTFSANKGGQP